MDRRQFFKTIGALGAISACGKGNAAQSASILVDFDGQAAVTARPRSVRKPMSPIPPSAFTHQAPLWLRRGGDEGMFDASTPEGYRKAMWLLRDVQAGQQGYPHPFLLQMLARAQAWLAVNSHHVVLDVLSGLRTSTTNTRTEGAAKASLHLPDQHGWFFAADIRAKGLDATYVAKLVQAVGGGGVGIYWERNFVHADIGMQRTWVKR